MLLPEACHDQVIFDDVIDDFSRIGRNPEAFEHRGGDGHAGLGMPLDALALADVVQQENQVEQGGLGGLVQDFAVALGARIARRENGVKFPDRAERVDVRGVPVVVLVLHEADERREFRHEASEHAEFVHERQGRMDLAGLLHDGLEAEVGVGGFDHLPGDELHGAADQRGEVEVRSDFELLAVAEHADQAHRVLLEDVAVFVGQFASADQEAVDAFGALGAPGEHEVLERADQPRRGGDAEREAFFDRFRNAEDGLRVPVVILHERLDALEQVLLRVAEVGGEPRLGVEVEHVGRMPAHVVQLVANPEQEIVGVLHRAEFGRLEVVLLGEFLEARDAEAHAGHPERVLVVAQAADAVLDVGFLDEDRVAVLGAPAGLVAEAGHDVGLGVVLQVMFPVRVGEVLVERGRAGEETGFEEGRLGFDLAAGLGEDLGQGARGVPDLQLEVPHRVQDAVGEMLLELRELGRFADLGIEEHHVDVAQRAQFGPAIPAERHEADRGRRFAMLVAPGGEGGREEGHEQAVHAIRQRPGDQAARFARLVAFADALSLGFQVGLAGRQAGGGRRLGREDRLVGRDGGRADGHRLATSAAQLPRGKLEIFSQGRRKF